MAERASTTEPVPAAAPDMPAHYRHYDGSTYYGRAQLKPAPFQNPVVGGYIFVAGLSGGAAILAALADAVGGTDTEGLARKGRYLALLAPIVGAPLLIYDLHTPKRFYNMLRVAKSTSPMSIGTWILMSFSATGGVAGAAQFGCDVWPRWRWLGALARWAGVPTAIAGVGLSTYTAALLSATSVPVWAASPRTLAIRFGSSSIAAAASALALIAGNDGARNQLGAVAATALVVEAAATAAAEVTYERRHVSEAFRSGAGRRERIGAVGVGVALPLGLLAAAAFLPRQRRTLVGLASLAALSGSAILRVATLSVGDESAARPDVSFRFSTPENLPRP